jgi:predicted metal-dependent hydrolase
MKKLMILGKNSTIIEQESDKDSLQFKNNKIFITSHKRPASALLEEFLAELLYSQLFNIYEQIKREERVEVFGGLDFEIVEEIDNKKQRIAKLKGNKILVKLNAVALPKSALKYMIVHEIAHTLTKRHSEKFWKIVKTIYPNFERGQKLFMNHEKFLCKLLT